jgi:hypothetical protein
MSSRSLAAARAKRAGEAAPPVSGGRPVTSIGSSAAFSHKQQNMPNGNNNVRTGKQQQQQQQQQQPPKSNLPFSKLTISDAIGLITLRLGRIEQWVIDNEDSEFSGSSNIPENSKIVDVSILNNIVSRLDALEKREIGDNNSEISVNVAKLTQQIDKIVEEGNKHNLAIAKHTEQLFKFDRDLVETKDLLKTFMMKYDTFTSDITTKFDDYEIALTELEKNIQPTGDVEDTVTHSDSDSEEESTIETSNSIMNADLKNIIKQELASK